MLHGFGRCGYGRDEHVGYGREGFGAWRRMPGFGIDRVGAVGLEGTGGWRRDAGTL